MKKSLVALAVASAFAAPAFAATSNVDVYGVVHFAVEDTNADNRDVEVKDRVSRIGFKGTEDLGGGLKAIWQIEQQINATNTNDSQVFRSSTTNTGSTDINVRSNTGAFGGAGLRNTFVGLSGGFGTVLAGRHDTPYKLGTGSLDPFADTIADYNAGLDGVALIDGVHDYRSPQAIAYISPTWSGFHVAVAAIATNDGAFLQLKDWNGAGGWPECCTVLNPGNMDNGDTFDAYSATAVYANGPLFASLSYQDVNLVDSTAWKFGLGYSFGDLKLGGIYESVDKSVVGLTSSLAKTAQADRDSWLLNATYAMGNIVLKAEYGQVDIDATTNMDLTARAESNQDMYALGADYNFSKRTTAYAIYTAGDNDSGDDVGGWALGMKHSF